MKNPPKSLSLWRHIWRSYIRTALLPLILLELTLVLAYLVTNNFVRNENLRGMYKVAHEELSRLVQQESSRIEKELHSVEQLTALYSKQTERAYQTPYTPGKEELGRYRFSTGGVLVYCQGYRWQRLILQFSYANWREREVKGMAACPA